jgi:endonuclease/exonuclease/phosphatase family metal-dependent hydrolase
MTAGCLSRIKADPDVQSKWIITNRDGIFGVSYGSATWYGQMTLVKKQTASVLGVRDVYLGFQGKELRPLHIVDIEIKSAQRRMQVINVHLQSLEQEGMARWEQIKLAALLADQAHPKMTILVGDTNFYTKEGMDTPTLAGFIDLWKILRPNEPGYTFGLTYPIDTASSVKRIDGVFQWPSPLMTPSQISTFGEESLQESARAFLSDHIGLIATFVQKSD